MAREQAQPWLADGHCRGRAAGGAHLDGPDDERGEEQHGGIADDDEPEKRRNQQHATNAVGSLTGARVAPTLQPMNLVTFHRVLIATAILFCAGYGVWEIVGYTRGTGTAHLLIGLAALAAAALLLFYLRRLRRFLNLRD
jgi:hypothetical protein